MDRFGKYVEEYEQLKVKVQKQVPGPGSYFRKDEEDPELSPKKDTRTSNFLSKTLRNPM